jgi:DNA-binding MarR family transcriptional regulator/GNAT superfamily N-acetyltransferase
VSDLVGQVRSFNRSVTQRVGVLNDAYLARDRPLGQARLLWEIGPDGADVRSLRERLELDSGYLSRLLRALESDGLVVVDDGDADRRVRRVRLTRKGKAERAVLDRRSDALAESLLEPLSDAQRSRLVVAMAEVERLLTASAVRITVRDPRHADARACLDAYFAELRQRFDAGFDPAVSRPAPASDMRPPAGVFLVATLHGQPVGCGGLKLRRRAPAEIKRMWVSPDVRGLGVGRRLLAALEARAADNGARAVVLDTNRALTEAIAMYRSAGYCEVPAYNDEPYAHHWFRKELPRRSRNRGRTSDL